jgi:hypothetical protein
VSKYSYNGATTTFGERIEESGAAISKKFMTFEKVVNLYKEVRPVVKR